ncbi:dimethylarginine dimethylaminohydrolase family protein [Sediminibacillus halophilus]|uniref:N-Dimethylarginine dimethylaminohydrolase n=1 Tax=Sediminibacillus halophilus TaxID=482461 RepID=A0A1G9VF69_9BACI|nr:arginine deiminase family protein [Sediminibacillus halophilus]SDM70872.1 N-Dimethylarginine dimethylaminohydrolase [Sediminibacillus halophilus]
MIKSEEKTIECTTEYHKLETLFICRPKYMEITEIINETQRHYINGNIDVDLAMEQHEDFARALEKHGAEVIRLEPEHQLNEQVFTRDIGFCIGDRLFLSEMKTNIRGAEVDVLKQNLQEKNIAYHRPFLQSIEGGDVMVDGNKIWVGISKRTTREAADTLQSQLGSDYQVIPLPLDESILHLDCAFNVLSPDWALVYPDAFTSEDYQKLKQNYQLIEVSAAEQFSMGTNVLSIGGGKVISMPQNKDVNEKMRRAGFHVIEVEFSEIIKSGGSFRCCSLPMYRSNS